MKSGIGGASIEKWTHYDTGDNWSDDSEEIDRLNKIVTQSFSRKYVDSLMAISSVTITNPGLGGWISPNGISGISGAMGPTGPSGFSISSRKTFSELSEFTPTIREYRRLFDSDIAHLNSGQSELTIAMKRNRLLVTLPAEAANSRSLQYWIEKYERWLDDNISGFYMLEGGATGDRFVLSFETEADMMQFALAFK